MTTDEARNLFATSGLKYSHLSRERLQNLRKKINEEMKRAKLMKDTLRCKQRFSLWESDLGFGAFLECRSFYFDGREAVSFNRDGFIGFAGWSDSTNVAPILAGFERWVKEVSTEILAEA